MPIKHARNAAINPESRIEQLNGIVNGVILATGKNRDAMVGPLKMNNDYGVK